jgi:hypothetical protein
LNYGDTELSESCIGLAQGQIIMKMGERILAVLLICKNSVSSDEEYNLGRHD